MKLWTAALLDQVTQECGTPPSRLNVSLDPRSEREAVVWFNGDGSPYAKYYPALRKLKKYGDAFTSETLFYDCGSVAQITSITPGTMTTECFDRAGNPVDFADFNELRN